MIEYFNIKNILILLCIGIFSVVSIYTYVQKQSYDFIITRSYNETCIDSNLKAEVGMILGARVYANGNMSPMLSDRVNTALECYNEGFFEKFLISGDHGQVEYDEVNTIRKYLLEQGVGEEDIFLDHAGFDTYDSMYRAKYVFGVESMFVFSQKFHLPRAIFIAHSFDYISYGIMSDRQEYANIEYNYKREFLAIQKACLNIILKSKPQYLGDFIDITGDGTVTWDS